MRPTRYVIGVLLAAQASVAMAGEIRHLAQQNQYSQLPICEHGVLNRAWTIGGFGLGAPLGVTIPEFLAWTESDLVQKLTDYLGVFPDLDAQTDHFVILDIEHPVHPKDLGAYIDEDDPNYDPDLFAALVEAIKLRIAVARSTFPNAQIALYGTIVPHGQGNDQADLFVRRMNGYVAAGELGMYDQLDRLVPVLYQNFGPSDVQYHTIDDMTVQAIVFSRLLTTSSGASIPLLPFLGFKVNNGNSNHHGLQVLPEDLAMQVGIVRAEGERSYAFWSGSDDSSGEPLTILDFFDILYCPTDVTGSAGIPDGTVDVVDLLAVLGAWGQTPADLDCMADVSCDGTVGVDDLLLILSAWGPCP